MRILKLLSVFIIWEILFLYLPANARTQEVSGYTVVSAVELKKLQDAEKEVLLLIDTRPYPAYKQEHIPGAKHFEFPNGNMDQWDKSKTGGKSQEEFLGLLGENKDRPLVFYCTDAN